MKPFRHSPMTAGSSVLYCSARPTLEQPWYQIAPRTAIGKSGESIPLKQAAGTFGKAPGLVGSFGSGFSASEGPARRRQPSPASEIAGAASPNSRRGTSLSAPWKPPLPPVSSMRIASVLRPSRRTPAGTR